MTRPYLRVCKAPSSLFLRTSLWRNDDHLLQVRSSGFNEQYQRFALADIRAFLIAPSSRRLWVNVIIAALTLLFASLPAMTGLPFEGGLFFYLVATLCFALFLRNTLRGPTCRAFVITRVQTEEIGALVRVRKAREVIESLRPLIEAAQAGQSAQVAAAASEDAPPPLPPAL
ncbi:hypothetical protein [Nibricoccus sp. IMCC34717]|uniref:hypothetical protein n=1 Tax=Nibricoccus sp. IMCC34717 TaxID=3034021 RepID=UPI00384EEE30